jgi:hypothetical protein
MYDELPEAPEVSRETITSAAAKKAARNLKIESYTRIERLACIVFEVGEHEVDCGRWWPLHGDDPACCAGDGFGGLLALFNRLVAGGVKKQEFLEAVHRSKPTLGKFNRHPNKPKKLFYAAPRRADDSGEAVPRREMPYHQKKWSAEVLPLPFMNLSLRDMSKSHVVDDVRAKLKVSSRQNQ